MLPNPFQAKPTARLAAVTMADATAPSAEVPLADPAQRMAAAASEMDRLYRLPDRWLAEELLRLARAARNAYPAQLGSPSTMYYGPMFVWNVVPEVARRLGATRLNQQEATRCNIQGQSGAELRLTVASHLANANLGSLPAGTGALSPAEILGHDICNGNPVAMAVDRFAEAPEAGHDMSDWLARSVRLASSRRGHAATPYWSPSLQHAPDSDMLPEGPEAEPSQPRFGGM